MKDIELFNEFKKENNIDSDYATYEYDESSIKDILSGDKTKEYSLYDSYVLNHEPLPIKGDYAVIVDENLEALAVVMIDSVNIVEYSKVKQKADLDDEAKEMSLKLNSETLVVEENFRVVYKK